MTTKRRFQRPMEYQVPEPAPEPELDEPAAMKRALGLDSDDDDDDEGKDSLGEREMLEARVAELEASAEASESALTRSNARVQELERELASAQSKASDASSTAQMMRTQRRLSEAALQKQLSEAKLAAKEYKQVVQDLEEQVAMLAKDPRANVAGVSKTQLWLQNEVKVRNERIASMEKQMKDMLGFQAQAVAERHAREEAEAIVQRLEQDLAAATSGTHSSERVRELEALVQQLQARAAGSGGAAEAAPVAGALSVKELKRACAKLLSENKKLKLALAEQQAMAPEQQAAMPADAVPAQGVQAAVADTAAAAAAATAKAAAAEASAALKSEQERSAHMHAQMIDLQERHAQELGDLRAAHAEAQDAARREASELKKHVSRAAAALRKKAEMRPRLAQAGSAVRGMRQDVADLRDMMLAQSAEMKRHVQVLEKRIPAAAASVAASQQGMAKEAMARYRKEAAERRKLYNEIQELRGNIRVYCRVRPLSEGEIDAEAAEGHDRPALAFPTDGVIEVFQAGAGGKVKRFDFDHVYAPDASQEAVFQDMKPLVASVLDGFNVCIFAYGQTGSGKTHTMMGPRDNPGVNHRALTELFALAQQRSSDWHLVVEVSVLEIYNDALYDLLGERAGEKAAKLDVQQSANGMHVPGLVEVRVASVEDVMQVLDRGMDARSTFATDMNAHSSRSHLLLRVQSTCTNTLSGQSLRGRMTLVDLAGSERIAKSGAVNDAARLKEAQAINKSLSALGDVITALATKAAHVPYRNTKLTYLLQDSLGGNSKTLMFCAVNPAHSNVSETLSSLAFASRARAVELGRARRNTCTSAPGSAASTPIATPVGTPGPAATRIRQQ